MSKGIRRGCIITLLSILVLLPLTERFLRIADPLGASRYYLDLGELFAGYVASDRGYSMYPGDYQFTNWTAQIDAQGNRAVPDSKVSGCQIAFVGDSVTFGFGVNDADTFVNRIAQQINAQVVNTAIPLYNSENVRMTIDSTPANGYVYMIVGNDDEATHYRENTEPIAFRPEQDVFGTYLDAMTRLNRGIQRDTPRFYADLEVMRREDVLLIAFEDAYWQTVKLPEYVTTTPRWTHSNSFVDSHPSAQGHAEIAAALMPYIRGFEGEVCQH